MVKNFLLGANNQYIGLLIHVSKLLVSSILNATSRVTGLTYKRVINPALTHSDTAPSGNGLSIIEKRVRKIKHTAV